jgi:hypothetical protein
MFLRKPLVNGVYKPTNIKHIVFLMWELLSLAQTNAIGWPIMSFLPVMETGVFVTLDGL